MARPFPDYHPFTRSPREPREKELLHLEDGMDRVSALCRRDIQQYMESRGWKTNVRPYPHAVPGIEEPNTLVIEEPEDPEGRPWVSVLPDERAPAKVQQRAIAMFLGELSVYDQKKFHDLTKEIGEFSERD